MPIKKITKDQILDIALDVFRKNGYHHTAMSDLATACGLQKGSFYHYFTSKETLMQAVLEKTLAQLQAEVFPLAYKEGLPARTRMEQLIKKFSEVMLLHDGGCIAGNLTLETAGNIALFKQTLRQIFDTWTAALKHIFEDKFSPEMSHRLAEQAVMEFEGAAMLHKIYTDGRFYRDCYQRIISKL
jgi:TetR/AcrR family transcriptional regulator, transcriptional repressor for nem operon